MTVNILLLFLANVVFNASGNVLMKHGSGTLTNLDVKSFSSIWSNIVLNPPLVSGVFCYGLSLIFYIFILQKIELSVAYPIIVACTAILVNVASQVFFHESVSLSQIAGYAVVVFGLYLIVRN